MKTIRHFEILILLFISLSKPMFGQLLSDDSKRLFAQAEEFFQNKDYSTALDIYKTLDTLHAGNANISFKIGYCYLNSSSRKTFAIPYFENALLNISDNYSLKKNETDAPLTTLYYLGCAYKLNYKFDKAIENFNLYKERLTGNKNFFPSAADADHEIECCKNAKQLLASPVNATITNLGRNINTEYTDITPIISLDEQTLIFTSKRDGESANKKYPDGQYYEDVYVSQSYNGQWQKPVSISKNINTSEAEAAINLSVDGQKLLIYKSNSNGDIYISELNENEWSAPKAIAAINSEYWETHACFSADNTIIYFVSDRPGGFGGRDIYKSIKLPNGEWGAAQNLGSTVNTQYDEDGIFIHPDGKQLFFSSKGHKSMGGFDIFSSRIEGENGNLSEPVNLGAPINTPDDDIFYVTTPDGKRAYLSSARDGGEGNEDLYMITFPENEPRDITVLVGSIVNESKQTIRNSKLVISVLNKNNKEEINQELIANYATGKYGTVLSMGKIYKLSYFVNDKLFHTEIAEVPYLVGYNIIKKDVPYTDIKQ